MVYSVHVCVGKRHMYLSMYVQRPEDVGRDVWLYHCPTDSLGSWSLTETRAGLAANKPPASLLATFPRAVVAGTHVATTDASPALGSEPRSSHL